jgi:hypothetical protein
VFECTCTCARNSYHHQALAAHAAATRTCRHMPGRAVP